MRRKLWLLVSLMLIVVAIALPGISPLSIPTEKECKDYIDQNVCVFVDRVETYCCLSKMMFDCKKVKRWRHKIKGTYHFTDPTECYNLDTACSPYNNPCK